MEAIFQGYLPASLKEGWLDSLLLEKQFKIRTPKKKNKNRKCEIIALHRCDVNTDIVKFSWHYRSKALRARIRQPVADA
jgi:hypothetical protein